jgi:hypothetical protein
MPPYSEVEDAIMGGQGSAQPQFLDWLQKMGVKTLAYNEKDIQSVASEVCGLYASYFCKHGLPVKNKKAWSFLSSNVNHNDTHIKALVRV